MKTSALLATCLLVACSAQGGGGGGAASEVYTVMAAAQGTSDDGGAEACGGAATLTVDGSGVTLRATGVACSFAGRRDGDVITLTGAQECVVMPRRATLRMTLQAGQVRVQGMGVSVTLRGRYARLGSAEVGAWDLTASGLRGG